MSKLNENICLHKLSQEGFCIKCAAVSYKKVIYNNLFNVYLGNNS